MMMDDKMGPPDGEVAVAVVAELTPDEMEELQRLAEEQEQKKQDVLSSLAGDIEAKYTDRKSRRKTKEREWIESMRLYLGSLSAGYNWTNTGIKTLSSNPDSGSVSSSAMPNHNLVRTKCDIAIAIGISAQFAGGDKNWDIVPTPVAQLGMDDPNAQKFAEIAAENMEKEIEDQLVETRYGFKCRTAYEDRVILGTGIMKGPVPARDAQLTYDIMKNGEGGVDTIPKYKVLNRPVVYRVDPWMAFPDDTVSDGSCGTDFIELHPMSKIDLLKLKKNPGFFADAIDSLLKMEPASYQSDTMSDYASLTDAGTNFMRNKYQVLEYHGPISVDQLGVLGIEPSYEPLGETYFGEVWVCQGQVLRVELETISGAFEIPYFMCPWLKDPNSPFGFGLPQVLKDPQRMAATALEMIQENCSISSGPQFVINKAFISPTDDNWSAHPHKVWLTDDYTLNNIDQAFKQFQPNNVTAEIMPVLQFAREIAQEESNLPQLAGAGLQSPQVGADSATGLGIMQQQSTTVSDLYNEMWDDFITDPLIRRMYHWNMQYNPKPDIVGDFDIDVRSSTEYRQRQMAVRDVEKLSVEAAQNPELAKVINQADLQRVRLSMMHLPTKSVVKSEEQIRQEEEQAKNNPPPPDPAMLKAQADMAKIEVDKERVALERERLQFEMTLQQRREEMDHAEKMGAIAARQQEAQARVMEAASNREVEMLKLAQKDEAHRAQIMADLAKSQLSDQTQRFLAGIKTNEKLRDQALTAEEMRIKKTQGTGI